MSKSDSTSEDAGCARRWGVCFVLAVVLLGTGVGGGIYWDYRNTLTQLVLQEGETRTIRIEEGATWSEVLDRLESADLLVEPRYVELWARRRGLPSEIEAGTYHFEGPLTFEALGAQLREGAEARDIEVTIPEGWTIFEIADRLDAHELVDREAFLKAAREDELLDRLDLDGVRSCEGYLFPDTYRFRVETTAEAILRRMHRRWRAVWEGLLEAHRRSFRTLRDSYDFDRHAIVTVASIVQAETQVDEERSLVARVVLNRLDASMPLQMDATCVYGPETYDEVPEPEHCDDESNAYSTYAHDGLPPGPIGNPGRSSLKAALRPARGEEAQSYLYYVARQDGTGRHVFSKTYREHRRAIERYLK